ncbi:hypothetical protein SCAR479_05503 [Seiridium cardinale]|uniref:Uncharacterized protein n=1 Tax=Seiridium cardinale TaxID=138064 RepID=A0ABR2XW96_9PEZI
MHKIVEEWSEDDNSDRIAQLYEGTKRSQHDAPRGHQNDDFVRGYDIANPISGCGGFIADHQYRGRCGTGRVTRAERRRRRLREQGLLSPEDERMSWHEFNCDALSWPWNEAPRIMNANLDLGSYIRHGPACACFCVYGEGEVTGSLPAELLKNANKLVWSMECHVGSQTATILAAKIFLGLPVPEEFRIESWAAEVEEEIDHAVAKRKQKETEEAEEHV